jgi:hypothetical protein
MIRENNKSSTFTMAHNKFSDWTPEEKKKILGGNPKAKPRPPTKKHAHQKEKLEAFWIFGDCEPGQYKNWLLGCRECDAACQFCSGKFFGGSDC